MSKGIIDPTQPPKLPIPGQYFEERKKGEMNELKKYIIIYVAY